MSAARKREKSIKRETAESLFLLCVFVLSFARAYFLKKKRRKFLSSLGKDNEKKWNKKMKKELRLVLCARAHDSTTLSLSLSLSISRKRADARAREKGCGLCALILKRYTITKNTDTYIYLLPFFPYEFYFWGLLVFEPIEIFVPLLPISHQRVDFFL